MGIGRKYYTHHEDYLPSEWVFYSIKQHNYIPWYFTEEQVQTGRCIIKVLIYSES